MASISKEPNGRRTIQFVAGDGKRRSIRLGKVSQREAEEIARILNTSPKTVENHRARLMQRLHIREVAGLVRYAIRSGMIEARP